MLWPPRVLHCRTNMFGLAETRGGLVPRPRRLGLRALCTVKHICLGSLWKACGPLEKLTFLFLDLPCGISFDSIIIYIDSGAVWDYVVDGIWPPGHYLNLVALARLRVRARHREGPELQMRRVASLSLAEPGHLARSMLRLALNSARRYGSAS